MSDARSQPEAAPPERRLSLSEMAGLVNGLDLRTDTIWQRVVYLHAAMVAAMAFFADAEAAHWVARIGVFAFYTANLVIAAVGLRECYRALAALHADVDALPRGAAPHGFHDHLARRSVHRRGAVRTGLMAAVWTVIGALLLGPGIL